MNSTVLRSSTGTSMNFSGMKKLIRERVALLEWQISSMVGDVPENSARAVRRVVIMPSDGTSIVGAKGDEAMITAVVETLTLRHGKIEVGILTLTKTASEIVRGIGYYPVEAHGRFLKFIPIKRAVAAFNADLLIVLGADVMDGYYSPMASMRLLAGADLVARSVCPAVILGFSFNERPNLLLKPIFDGLSSGVRINVRDPISYERFRRFTSTKAYLVADSAFMMKPESSSPAVQEIEHWVDGQKRAGRMVLAFNIHPMLVRNASPEQAVEFARRAAEALSAVMAERPVSVVLLSHDYRGDIGDDVCLAPLMEALGGCCERMLYPRKKMTAAELKGAAACMDAVITGRMHLAIAALGCGVPVAAFSYQDKFSGLFAHFGLPGRLILSPEQISTESIRRLVLDIVENCSEWTSSVREYLPRVRELSAQNIP